MISYTSIKILLCFLSTYSFATMPEGEFEKYKNKYFVETGTYIGKGVEKALKAGFPIIHSIETVKKYALEAQEQFKELDQVHIWHGSSAIMLYDIIKDINEPITFWLDAHDAPGKKSPILAELDQIKQHHIKMHTILIDDMRLSGNVLFNFVTKQTIIAKIKEINPNYQIIYIDGGEYYQFPNDIMVARVLN